MRAPLGRALRKAGADPARCAAPARGRRGWAGALALALVLACRSAGPENAAENAPEHAPENDAAAAGNATAPAPPRPEAPGSPAAAEFAAGTAAMRARRYDEGRVHFERAAAAAEREGRTELQVEALAQVARMHSILHDEAAGRPFLERAAELASPEEPAGWARYLLVRGVYERESGRGRQATETFRELYDFCMAHELPERAIDAAHMIALVAPPEEQVTWARRGIAAAEAAGEERWLAVLWNNLGATYDELGRYPEMLEAYEQARFYHRRASDEMAGVMADWAVGRAHRKLGHAAEARRWLEPVLAWFEQRDQAGEDGANGEWIGYTLWELGEVDLLEGDRGAARERLERARQRLVEAGIESWWPEGLAELDAARARARE